MPLIDLLNFSENGWGLFLLGAVLMTIAVTFAALVIGAVIGSFVAWAKLSKSLTARIAGDAYTTIFRGVPELLIIYLVFFGGSAAVTMTAQQLGIEGTLGLPSFLAGAIGVGLISASYQAEVYRGSFIAIVPGEIEAARAVGMPRMMRFRRIIAPQVLRFAIPGLGNVWQLSLKDSALVSVTGLVEIMNASNKAAGSTHQFFNFYTVGGALYLILTASSGSVFNFGEAYFAKSLRRPAGVREA